MKRQKSSASKKNSEKEQLKKVSLKSKISAALKKARQEKSNSLPSTSRKTVRRTTKKVNLNLVQQEVSQAKFHVGAPASQTYVPYTPSQDLPGRYHEDKIVVQVRDPWWIHTYWEVKNGTVENIKNSLGARFQGAKVILRVYDVSFINFNGNNAHGYFDIEVGLEAQNWYIDVGSAGRSWCIDIGFRLNDGTFVLIARSNVVTTPLDGPSWITDEEWMVPEEIFARLYGMGFGMGPASPTAKSLIKRVKGERLRMQHISSPALFSMSSPRKVFIKKGKKGFWLIVNTELIVYGATEPDAKVTVQGKPIKLNSDGTFSLRFALPDGKQTIPVEARSADGDDYRSVTPVVSKKTQ